MHMLIIASAGTGLVCVEFIWDSYNNNIVVAHTCTCSFPPHLIIASAGTGLVCVEFIWDKI